PVNAALKTPVLIRPAEARLHPHQHEHVERRPRDGRWPRRVDADRARRCEADHGQLERSTRVNATRDRWAIKVLGVLYNVAVTHMEDAGDVHANRTLLRPIIDDDVGSTRLIVVR